MEIPKAPSHSRTGKDPQGVGSETPGPLGKLAGMYTLDTNTIIYYLRDDAGAATTMREILGGSSPLYVSAITEVELFSFPLLDSREVTQIEGLLDTVAVIPVDSQIARVAGSLRRTYGLKTADSVIAATALFTGTILVTRNIRDFRKIRDLQLRRI